MLVIYLFLKVLSILFNVICTSLIFKTISETFLPFIYFFFLFDIPLNILKLYMWHVTHRIYLDQVEAGTFSYDMCVHMC